MPVGPTALVRPDLELYDAWAACVEDYSTRTEMHGSGWWWIQDFGADRRSCAELIRRAAELRTEPPEGLVVSDCYWITAGPEIAGFLMLRHSLDNEFLRTQGGHIGYSVRPSLRRQGVGSHALGLALNRAADLGLDRVLVTCDDDNVASARTIESRGGVFESLHGDKRRYWVPTRSLKQ